MPHAVTSLKRPSSYSHCPLKKRPLKYDPLEDPHSDSDLSSKGASPCPLPVDPSEPENLSTKPEDLRLNNSTTTLIKEKAPLSPPPISLVAGRGDGNTLIAHQQQFRHAEGPQHFDNNPAFPYHQHHHVKPNGNGPLGPINLNAPANWSKVHPSYMPMSVNYVPPRPNNNYMGAHSPRSSSLGQFPSSHFTPYRESGSPPHVSPPLTHEPAYPVLRIEELNNRKAMSPSHPHHYHHHHQDEACVKRESCQNTEVTQYKTEHPEYREYYTYQLSPSHSSNDNSRDSVISHHSSGCGSNNNNSSEIKPVVPVAPINVNGSVRYQCPDCNKSYSTYSGLSKHMQFHCANQNKKSFVCKYCEKVYVSLGALKMHIRTHTLPCKCNICGKAFSRPWLLQGHIRTHTGEKPFTCQHCHRAFADRSNLRAHLQTHSEIKKYSCKTCSKTFSRMSLLVKHEEGGCSTSSSPLHMMTSSECKN